jgi:hypothetical protein
VSPDRARGSTSRRSEVSERARVLKVGAALLALLTAGLVVGFLVLRGNKDSPPPSTSTTGTPTPTSTDVRAQVEQGYLHAWDVWAEALMELNPSRLPEVLMGQALEVITGQVEEQARKNQPVQIRVEHNYRIVIVNDTTASIDDRYINHNVRLDPETLEPIEEDPNHRERTSFTMKLVDGTWRISEIIEYES